MIVIDILSLLVLTFSPVNIYLLQPHLLIMRNFYSMLKLMYGTGKTN